MSVALLFPGQGAQQVGMAGELAGRLPAAAELFGRAAGVLGYDLLAVCRDGPKERLNATDVSQPAIFVSSLAALESLKAEVEGGADDVAAVTATAGLSLGEYTALVFAGAMDFEDALEVVQKRGRAMQAAAEANPGGMVSVLGLDDAAVEEVRDAARGKGLLEVANRLCPGNVVLSGELAACDEAQRLAEEKRARTVRLAVAGAFHTELMRPAVGPLAEALAAATIRPCRVPVWSNVDAETHTEPADFRDLLVRQVVSPVLWEATSRGLLAAGVTRFYEVGPGRVLAGLMKRVERKADFRNVPA